MNKKIKQYGSYALIFLLVAYIANLGAGIIEFIPDNIPIFGNLDEGLAGALIALLGMWSKKWS